MTENESLTIIDLRFCCECDASEFLPDNNRIKSYELFSSHRKYMGKEYASDINVRVKQRCWQISLISYFPCLIRQLLEPNTLIMKNLSLLNLKGLDSLWELNFWWTSNVRPISRLVRRLSCRQYAMPFISVCSWQVFHFTKSLQHMFIKVCHTFVKLFLRTTAILLVWNERCSWKIVLNLRDKRQVDGIRVPSDGATQRSYKMKCAFSYFGTIIKH